MADVEIIDHVVSDPLNDIKPLPPTQLATRRTNPEALIERAIDKGANIETIERLMVLRNQLRAENSRDAYFADLAAFQAECGTVEKTKKAGGGNFAYKYAPFDQIISQVGETLAKFGFSYGFDVDVDNGKLKATCNSYHRDGHTEKSSFAVPIDTGGKMNAVQQCGSASTYAKRYAFVNCYGLVTADADDDAKGAAAPSPTGPPPVGPTHPVTEFPAGFQPNMAPAPIGPPGPAPVTPGQSEPESEQDVATRARALADALRVDKAHRPEILAKKGGIVAYYGFLDLIERMRRTRIHLGISDNDYTAALVRRCVQNDYELTEFVVKEMLGKMFDALTPSDRVAMGLTPEIIKLQKSPNEGMAGLPESGNATSTPPATLFPSPPKVPAAFVA